MKKFTLLVAALAMVALSANAVVYNVTVPAGTNACYIAGEMNSWSFTEMTKVDATHYTLDLADATEAMGYQYTCGPDWAYVEKAEDGTELQNRAYSANDVVATWAKVYVPETPSENPDQPATGTGDITIRINSGSDVPRIWWWSGNIPAPTVSWDERPNMTPVAGMEGWYEYTFQGVDLSIGISIKITLSNSDSGDVTGIKANTCFDASFVQIDCGATAVENVLEDNARARKIIENGQLIILKNGVKYNALGAMVK